MGVLFRAGAALEHASAIDRVFFDKTGTLTTGAPELVAIEPMAGVAADELLAAAAAVEVASEHPFARAVVAAARAGDHDAPVEGLSCWTDAALFNAAGIPALCFGPGDIARAHSAEEWVERSQIVRATQVLEQVCSAWGR